MTSAAWSGGTCLKPPSSHGAPRAVLSGFAREGLGVILGEDDGVVVGVVELFEQRHDLAVDLVAGGGVGAVEAGRPG